MKNFQPGLDYYFGLDGEPLELMQWADLFEDFPARTVAEENWGDLRVLTVWLGTDPDYWGPDDEYGPPKIFGTAVFRGGVFQAAQEILTPSREEAEKAHRETVRRLKGVT